jgi:hypothetical protein
MESSIRCMTRKERCELFEKNGFKYNPETGEITGRRGKVITSKRNGYIYLGFKHNKKLINLMGAQFAWWIYYKEIHEGEEFVIDHQDRNPSNNRISNLRLATQLENNINMDRIENCKGYTFHNQAKKWLSRIIVDGEQKYLGGFDTEQEAREAYLAALEFYYPDRYTILKNKNML